MVFHIKPLQINMICSIHYETIRKEGTQAKVIDTMQTREELYERINYYEYEKALDKFLEKN